jgi:hypothetical protein
MSLAASGADLSSLDMLARVMRASTKLGSTVLLLVATAACTEVTVEPTCKGMAPDMTVVVKNSGASHAIEKMSFARFPVLAPEPHDVHLAYLHFAEDVFLGVFFRIDTPTSTPLPLDPLETTAPQQGAELKDFNGFEGSAQSVCDTGSTFGLNGAVSGVLEIDATSVDAEGMLTSIDGCIDVQVTNCTVMSLGVAAQDVYLVASF